MCALLSRAHPPVRPVISQQDLTLSIATKGKMTMSVFSEPAMLFLTACSAFSPPCAAVLMYNSRLIPDNFTSCQFCPRRSQHRPRSAHARFLRSIAREVTLAGAPSRSFSRSRRHCLDPSSAATLPNFRSALGQHLPPAANSGVYQSLLLPPRIVRKRCRRYGRPY